MTLTKRLDAVEDNLTPREAVIRWMREAHEFGSYEAYFRWLLEQADDVYPLIRLPRQAVGAVRAQHKGVSDARLRSEFYRVQKDVLFLYLLHKQVEMWALAEREALQLRVVMLVREIRALRLEKHELDQMRLARVNLEGKKHPRPGSLEKSTRAHYQAHVDEWLPEQGEVLVRILSFVGAAQLISRRYFAGEDILYPATREHLRLNLETIANLREIYDDTILGAPQTDDEFRDYVLALVYSDPSPAAGEAGMPTPPAVPDATGRAKVLAEQWVLMAKSETLEKLGEEREAERLAEQLLRSLS